MPRVILPPGGRIVPVVCPDCHRRSELVVEKGQMTVLCPNRCRLLAVSAANAD